MWECFTIKSNRTQENSSLNKIENPYFEVNYDASLFSKVPVQISLPTNYTISYSGIKLLDSKSFSNMGKKECSSGELSEEMSVCTAENQPGLSFILINKSIDNEVSLFNKVGVSESVIGNKKFVIAKISSVGSGSIYYFYPVSTDKTLIIKRSIIENNILVPEEHVFNKIISSLIIK